jgi:Protein of unknown function (DUF2793)
MALDDTPNLKLPYIAAAQAQKHVTHNEAIRALDAIVQIGVLDRDLTAPPPSPAEGARYIVASAATGDWLGKEDTIAAYQDGAWLFYEPGEGWIAWAADEDALLAWNGAAWVVAGGGGGGAPGGSNTQVQFNDAGIFAGAGDLYWDKTNGRLGIGAGAPAAQLEITKNFRLPPTSDATTGVISLGATHFVHAYGTNNLFLGLGAGNFTLSGAEQNVGVGAGVLASLTSGDNNVGLGLSALSGVTEGSFNLGIGYRALQSVTTGGSNVAFGNDAARTITTGSNNTALGHSAMSNCAAAVSNNTAIGYLALQSVSSNDNTAIGRRAGLSATSAAGNALIGNGTAVNLTTGDYNTVVGTDTGGGITTGGNNTILGARVSGLSASLANTVILADGAGNIRTQIDSAGRAAFAGSIKPQSYAVAGLPSAADAGPGAMIFVTDEMDGAVPAFSDGTDWRRVSDRAVVS